MAKMFVTEFENLPSFDRTVNVRTFSREFRSKTKHIKLTKAEKLRLLINRIAPDILEEIDDKIENINDTDSMLEVLMEYYQPKFPDPWLIHEVMTAKPDLDEPIRLFALKVKRYMSDLFENQEIYSHEQPWAEGLIMSLCRLHYPVASDIKPVSTVKELLDEVSPKDHNRKLKFRANENTKATGLVYRPVNNCVCNGQAISANNEVYYDSPRQDNSYLATPQGRNYECSPQSSLGDNFHDEENNFARDNRSNNKFRSKYRPKNAKHNKPNTRQNDTTNRFFRRSGHPEHLS